MSAATQTNDTNAWVADRLACQDVMASYAKGVDERDFVLYRSCFADDVEIVGFGAETLRGGDAWTEYVVGALENYSATQHMLGPQLASIDGDVAQCRTDVQAWHLMKEPANQTLTLWATYNSTMQRTPAGWKIIRHEHVHRQHRVASPSPLRIRQARACRHPQTGQSSIPGVANTTW